MLSFSVRSPQKGLVLTPGIATTLPILHFAVPYMSTNLVELPFLILELHFLILQQSDSDREAWWGADENQFEVITVTIERRTM